ncbi:Txe/YoeB family addiction module toxin [Streptomyces sp. NPDC001220]
MRRRRNGSARHSRTDRRPTGSSRAGGRPVKRQRGIGKPDPLKHGFQGYWSRRGNDEHRLIYKATEDAVLIAQCHYRYES